MLCQQSGLFNNSMDILFEINRRSALVSISAAACPIEQDSLLRIEGNRARSACPRSSPPVVRISLTLCMGDSADRHRISRLPVILLLLQQNLLLLIFHILCNRFRHHFRISGTNIGKICRLTAFLRLRGKNRNRYCNQNTDDGDCNQKLRQSKAPAVLC